MDIDRMANKATVIEIIGESYRVRQTKRWMEGNGTDTDWKRATLSRKSSDRKERLSGRRKSKQKKGIRNGKRKVGQFPIAGVGQISFAESTNCSS